MNERERKAFENYIRFKQPVVQDYQYIDDFVQDSMAYYRLLCSASKTMPTLWQKRSHRLIYVEQAEVYGLPYKTKEFQQEIEKERENNGI